MKYGGARIFDKDCDMRMDKFDKPVIVCREGEMMEINDDEMEALGLGPKFCVIDKLNEEVFEVAVEESIMKFRWDLMGREIEDKKRKDSFEVAIEAVIDDEQLMECEEYEEMEKAKLRMVFDHEDLSMDMSKRRTTDIKGNSRVIFPRRSKEFEV